MTENEIALNLEFARLDDVLRKFNIFQALGVQKREIKHSAFLGFLLDPNQTHGFGSKFLTEFLRLCSTRLDGNIPLLDLNISLAKVVFEIRFFNKKSLDLIVEIPYLSEKKRCVIAIENKIDSSESDGQLRNYSDGLRKHYDDCDVDLRKIFLTAHGDQPNDESWTGMTHSEVVLPAVEALLQNSEDTLSDYFIQVMMDYGDTINQASDSNKAADDLIASMDKKLIAAVQSDKGKLNRVSTLFPRAWAYLKSYESDPRVAVLRWFEASDVFTNPLLVESSTRNYLRLSFLSAGNRKNLIEICSVASRGWLASSANLVLELILSPSAGHNDLMDGRLKLVLGPTNSDFHHRQELFDYLRDKPGTNVSEHWAGIKLADLKPSLAKKGFSSLSSAQVQEWVQTELVNTANEIRPMVNERLERFFATKEPLGNASLNRLSPH
jgi:hypothetical protein